MNCDYFNECGGCSLGHLTYEEQLNEKILLEIFDKIVSYSPLVWIKQQEITPSGEAIKQHIHRANINIIKQQL